MTRSQSDVSEFMKIAIPVGVEAAIQRVFMIVEQIMVAYIGIGCVALAGVVNNLLYMTLVVLLPIGAGFSILIAQVRGQGNFDGVKTLAIASIVATTGISSLLSLLGWLFNVQLLKLFGVNDIPGATEFLGVLLVGGPMMIVGSVISNILRVEGRAKLPMAVTTSSLAVANCLTALAVYSNATDPQRMFAVGLAILAGYSVRLGLLVYLLWCHMGFSVAELSGNAALPSYMKRGFAIALPMSASKLVWICGLASFTAVFAQEGVELLAVSQIVIAVQSAFIMLASGVPVAANSLVGNAVGAGIATLASDRARKVIVISAVFSIILVIIMVASLPILPTIYGGLSEIQVWQLNACGIIAALSIPIIVLNMAIGSGIVASGGDTRFLFYIDAVATLLVGLPVALLLWHLTDLGISAVFMGRAVEETVRLTLTTLRYKTGRWNLSPVSMAS
ncbi:MATE family efflux transporter [Rhizobium sp. AU243]|uniref:MATE family efflux transporter n=1 Tax=Rhizobium sp. AU243 TaxID=2303425 RepID=UPI0010CBA5A5|nr:MATE family efflux transporter [Rhizobium sp. AU243]TKV70379.1 hypothetical protein D0C28_26430 [Rhizobium sp. AU243]